jgi:hypothetical protein
VARQIAANQDRGESLGVDRTPWENRPGRAGQANNLHCRSSGLTTPSIEGAKVRILSVLPGSQGRFESRPKKTVFFIAPIGGIFAELPEIRLDRAAGSTSLWARPFKIF